MLFKREKIDFGSQVEGIAHPRGERIEAEACGSWSYSTHSQEAERERDEYWCSAGFLLVIQSRPPA